MSTVSVEIKGKEDVSTAAKKAADGLGGVGKAAAGMAAALGPVAIATAVVIATIREVAKVVDECVTEFAANERAAIAFNAAIAQSGTISVAAGNALAKFAEEIADMTGETGESVQSMETLLVTSGRTEGEVRKLISAAVDMSAATGKDLRTSVEELNKTFSGTEGRMGQLIPELQSLTKEQLAAGAAVDVVAEKYRGMGDALQESTDVSIKNYQNAMDDLKASLGGLISLGLSPLRGWLTDIVRQWGEAASAARNYATAQAKIKGGKGVDTLAEVELEALNKKKLAYIEELKAIRSGSREGGDMYKLQTQEIDRVIAEQKAIAEALRNFSLDRGYSKYMPGAAPSIPSAGSGSDGGAATLNPNTTFQGWNFEGTASPLIDAAALAFYDEANTSLAMQASLLADVGAGAYEYGDALENAAATVASLTDNTSDFEDGWRNALESIKSQWRGWDGMVQNTIQIIYSGMTRALESVGAALYNQSLGWDTLGATALDVLAQVLRSIGAQLAGLAVVHGLMFDFVGMGLAIAGSAAAFIAAGVADAWASDVAAGSAPGASSTVPATGSSAAILTTGSSASYSTPRDITVNVSVTTSALVGDDGIRQFSLMIWREIKSAGVLGAA